MHSLMKTRQNQARWYRFICRAKGGFRCQGKTTSFAAFGIFLWIPSSCTFQEVWVDNHVYMVGGQIHRFLKQNVEKNCYSNFIMIFFSNTYTTIFQYYWCYSALYFQDINWRMHFILKPNGFLFLKENLMWDKIKQD